MGVSDCQEKAHKKKGNGALCAIHLPTRCLCLLGKQIMWRVLFCFLIKILCGSFSASIMSYKDKMKIPKTEILKSQPKRHCNFVEWMWGEPRSELRLETDFFPYDSTFSLVGCFQAAVGNDTETSLFGLPSLLHWVSCWAFLSAFSIRGLSQSSQFYMYLNLLLAKNQVSPLRVPSVWIFIYSFINIYSIEHLLCARSSVRCWECSKQDRHSLCFNMDCSLAREAV